ncbi:MAG TPA: hypothetical protein VMT38_12255 [Terracidiphilus sp.]|nr:hypothetical protein [Terracidiphilus sp.]
MNYFKDTFRRMRGALSWVAAQFWATLLLLLAGVAWTLLPDKHVWQVLLSLLVPLVLLALALLLEAGTMRKLFHSEKHRVSFPAGTLILLIWVAVVSFGWWLLDWCDDQIPTWAGYLNSRASAGGRATLFTYEHIVSWLTLLEWILRWIVIPAKIIPCAMASAQWGWRLPWRVLFRLLLNWRWWLAVVIGSLVGVVVPGHFFTGIPNGTVSHQVWAVFFKLAGAYLLAVSCWILLLAWAAALMSRNGPDEKETQDESGAPVPLHSGPIRDENVKLPLPEAGGDAGGDA